MTAATMTRREPIGKVLYKAGLSETRYGYFLRAPGLGYERTRFYEIAMAFAGTIVAVAVVGVFLVPALRGVEARGTMELSTAIMLLSLAGLLLRNASRGQYQDAEIDFEKAEVRLVRRNTRGGSMIEAQVPFDEIRSVFVKRSKARNTPSRLCIRVAGGDRDLSLVSGTEEAMSTLHRRLVRDINSEIGRTRSQHTEIRARDTMVDFKPVHAAVA